VDTVSGNSQDSPPSPLHHDSPRSCFTNNNNYSINPSQVFILFNKYFYFLFAFKIIIVIFFTSFPTRKEYWLLFVVLVLLGLGTLSIAEVSQNNSSDSAGIVRNWKF